MSKKSRYKNYGSCLQIKLTIFNGKNIEITKYNKAMRLLQKKKCRNFILSIGNKDFSTLRTTLNLKTKLYNP